MCRPSARRHGQSISRCGNGQFRPARRGGTDPAYWREAVDGVDAAVNTAGVLQPRRDSDAWAVHCHAPDALFAACENAGVRRVIQVSAVRVEEAETVYARSKRAGDEKLMARDLDWTVLRPAIVIGEGSYGGSSMLRAIAAFPWVTPVIGDGANRLDFVHKDDLALSIVEMLRSGAASKTVLEPASGERLTLNESVRAYRRWLGLKAAPVVGVRSSGKLVGRYICDLCYRRRVLAKGRSTATPYAKPRPGRFRARRIVAAGVSSRVQIVVHSGLAGFSRYGDRVRVDGHETRPLVTRSACRIGTRLSGAENGKLGSESRLIWSDIHEWLSDFAETRFFVV